MKTFHPRLLALLAACVVLIPVSSASATRWLGMPTAAGAVERHPAHEQVLLSQPFTQLDFEDLAIGVNVTGYALSGMVIYPEPLWASVVVRSAPVADVPPAGGSRAIEIPAVSGQGTALRIDYDQAVQVAGFAALNLNADYYVSTYDADDSLISRVLMPGVPSGYRQWVGVHEQGRDFFTLRIEPTAPGRYGIDNLEYSRHAPEPSAVSLWLAGLYWMRRRMTARR